MADSEGLYIPAPKHSCELYCDAYDTVDLPRDWEEDNIAGINVVAETRGVDLAGDRVAVERGEIEERGGDGN